MGDLFKNIAGFITIIFMVYLYSAYQTAKENNIQFNIVKSTGKVIHEIINDAKEGWSEAASDTTEVEPTPVDSDLEVL